MKKIEQNIIVKLNVIWATTLLGFLSMIGAFWGTTAYRTLGIVIGCAIVVSMYVFIARS